MMQTLLTTLPVTVRRLLRQPGLSATIVAVIALGTGANAAIFGVLNGILLRALPVERPHELRIVNWAGQRRSLSYFEGNTSRYGKGGTLSGSFPYPLYREFRDEVKGSAELFAFANLKDMTVLGPDGASTGRGLLVSGNYFSAYGAKALIGRTLTAEDDRSTATPVAVVSYRWWERHAGLDPEIVGRTVSVNQNAFVVVGVLPREYVSPLFGREPDVYAPLAAQPLLVKEHPLESGNHWWIQIMGRFAPGANEAQARSAMEALFRRHVLAPESTTRVEQPAIVLQDGSRGLLVQRDRLAAPLFALQGVVTLVLVIVCVNLSSLLLARSAGRRHEMAVRAALGAGRGRLVRESLGEGLVLALAGGALGLIVAAWIKAALLAAAGRFIEDFHINLATDSRVLVYALAVSILTALLFGLIPALRVSRVRPVADLAAGRGTAGQRLRLGRVLVSVQVGLSLLLVAGAALLLRTVAGLEAVNPGFATENMLVFQLNAEQAGHKGNDRLSFYGRVRERVAAIPGVRSVSLSNNALLGASIAMNGIAIPGRETVPGQSLQADELVVSDSFFSTMGIPIVLGRALASTDDVSARRVAVVNERFAQQFFDGQDPVGRTFERRGAGSYEIVGVCGNAKYTSLRSEVDPTMYLNYGQDAPPAMYVEVRSILPPLSLVPAVRRAVAEMDANVPLAGVQTQQALLERTVFPEKLLASLCAAFAAFAMLLSCIGLNGLVAHDVARRTSEFGVRMSLGATPARIAWPVVRDALAMAGWGLAFGLPAALALSLAMRGVLYGVKPLDPASMIGAVIALLLVAALAAWLPARRAAKADPMVALRCE